jgi:hypothetical protein
MILHRWSQFVSPRKIARSPKADFKPTIETLEERCLLSVDEVLRWVEVANEAARIDHGLGFPAQQFGPTRASRAFAIQDIAIYDAVAAIDGTYQPFMTTLPVNPMASLEAAIAQAGHDTLAVLYSNQKAMLDQALAADLAQIPDGPAKAAGIAIGSQTAANTLAVRANDGAAKDAVGQPVNYNYGQDPGQWRADPLHPNATPLTPDWGSVTPFVLTSGSQFRAPPPPALNSPEYTAAFNEVKALGGSSPTSPTTRSDEQTTIGLFWGYDAQPGLCAPVRFYNQIAETIAKQQGNTEVENARMFMLINVAMADAGITVWETKYYYNFWRPITAIREADPGTGPSGLGDGNPNTIGDPLWQPLGAPADNGNGTNFTPPFPSYTSGHAGFGGALFTTLANFYGTDNISFTIVSDEFNTITVDQNGTPRPLKARSYTSFSQAAEENGESRIYLGVHFNFDKVAGIQQGDEIANYIFARVGRRAMDDDQAFVNKLYRDLLNRSAEASGLAYWVGLLKQGRTHEQVAAAIQDTPEYRSVVVTNLFGKLLNRQVDALGLSYFTGLLAGGGTVLQVENQIMGSAEYFQVRGGGSNAGFLSAIYTDALGRQADALGTSVFLGQLNAGVSIQDVAAHILTSPEGRHYKTQTLYHHMLRRDADVLGMNYFSDALMGGSSDLMMEALMAGSAEYRRHV